jgi:hypothetical protein
MLSTLGAFPSFVDFASDLARTEDARAAPRALSVIGEELGGKSTGWVSITLRFGRLLNRLPDAVLVACRRPDVSRNLTYTVAKQFFQEHRADERAIQEAITALAAREPGFIPPPPEPPRQYDRAAAIADPLGVVAEYIEQILAEHARFTAVLNRDAAMEYACQTRAMATLLGTEEGSTPNAERERQRIVSRIVEFMRRKPSQHERAPDRLAFQTLQDIETSLRIVLGQLRMREPHVVKLRGPFVTDAVTASARAIARDTTPPKTPPAPNRSRRHFPRASQGRAR